MTELQKILVTAVVSLLVSAGGTFASLSYWKGTTDSDIEKIREERVYERLDDIDKWKIDIDTFRSNSDSAITNLQTSINQTASSVGEVSGRVTGLEGSKGIIQGDISVPENKWGAQRVGANTVYVGESICPDGQYVVAVNAFDNDSGDKCVQCLTNIQVVCAPL